jgi:methylmalonyl-CoA mutase cobalamin-binding subunit
VLFATFQRSVSNKLIEGLIFVTLTLQEDDHAELHEAGVVGIYGPGTRVPAAAMDMLRVLNEGRETMQEA